MDKYALNAPRDMKFHFCPSLNLEIINTKEMNKLDFNLYALLM
jgi:hypothetical protein